ncbi:MAG: DUF692 domain-containing protein [Myxococcales bacterium]|nr:DUF692 domain-containing protein [Myxococcales bacterium]MCB9519514.1 DUF692 domain-containing protein [Myxococcales bacterium]MCB9533261.1 DUF692 domain-containing protein [Myxococcales bacterium]
MSGALPAGVGLGLRGAFAAELLRRDDAPVRFVEVHPENYVRRGGRFEQTLAAACDRWPVSAHGLTVCFGDLDRPEEDYLEGLRELLRRTGSPWYSDHLCFAAFGNAHMQDLLPLLRTEEAAAAAATRVRELQSALGIPIAVENVSFYAASDHEEMSELELLLEVLERADCALLLDVNNVWVNSLNHGFDAHAYIDAIPAERVVQLHVAGHLTRPDGLIIDTHAEPICDGVFELLEYALRRLGPRPVLLERDGNYPALDELLAEVAALEEVCERAGAPR